MIRLEGLSKRFNRGGVNEVVALDGIDLHVRAGDFVSVIGSNGAGKSSLLNCLSGTHPIDAGRIFMGGRDVTLWPEHRRAACIGTSKPRNCRPRFKASAPVPPHRARNREGFRKDFFWGRPLAPWMQKR